MHIALTGASGVVGSHLLAYLLSHGHSVTAIDNRSLHESVPPLPAGSIFVKCDLTNYVAVEDALTQIPCDGVIHLAAIPNPNAGHDHRHVHNVNVVSSYNVMRTAAELGIKRIVQASSIHAIGASFTHESRRKYVEVPVNEASPRTPEDAYGLSKLICETQADSLCRLFPDIRIASIRFHYVVDPSTRLSTGTYADLWSWTSQDSASSACLLALTAEPEEWRTGHEIFLVTHDEINLTDLSGDAMPKSWQKHDDSLLSQLGSLEVLRVVYPDTRVRDGWFKDEKDRRGFYDTEKAKRLLGWQHD